MMAIAVIISMSSCSKETSNTGDENLDPSTVIEFKDDNFRNALLKVVEWIPTHMDYRTLTMDIDQNRDGQITIGEAMAATNICVYNESVSDMEELKYFTSLEALNCDTNNDLTDLDLSNNPKLKILECPYTGISELDLSNNKELVYLSCGATDLTRLDLSGCPSLHTLYCAMNFYMTEITGITVPVIEDYHLSLNNLKVLDLSSCTMIKSLDLNGNSSLQTIYLSEDCLIQENVFLKIFEDCPDVEIQFIK